MAFWPGVVLAVTLGGGWAADGQTDQALMAQLGREARRGDLERVLAGVAGMPVEQLDVLAQEATCGGQPAVLRALIERGARPRVFGAGALRCMLRARAARGSEWWAKKAPEPLVFDDAPPVEVIQVLLAGGVDLRPRFERGATVVEAAAATCHPALVSAVLEGKVDVEAAADSVTPLMLAARCPADVMAPLLAHGASGTRESQQHLTALEFLIRAGLDAPTFRSRLAALRKQGTRSPEDPTPISYAGELGNAVAITELVAAGWNPSAADSDWNTALHRLARSCRAGAACVDAARALVRAGASIDDRNKQDETPYDVAAAAGNAWLLSEVLARWRWRSLGALGAKVSVSNTLVEPGRAPDRYLGARALDGKAATCWCVGDARLPDAADQEDAIEWEASSSAPWIEVRFAHPVRVRGLRIYPGCGEVEKVFRANNRVAMLEVVVGGERRAVRLPDAMRFLDLGVSSGEDPVDSVRLVLQAVHRGARYDDTCIAEIQAVLE